MTGTTVERFWAKVKKSDGCWLWTASTQGKYGQFHVAVGESRAHAHRFSWELHFGGIPDGMYVCHKCDTPRCVRPDHLFLGTSADNTIDMCHKERSTRKLNAAKAREILNKYRESPTITQEEVARQYGIDRSTVSLIVHGKLWKHNL
jgi:DNA-binding XRE family transcriptional regulator